MSSSVYTMYFVTGSLACRTLVMILLAFVKIGPTPVQFWHQKWTHGSNLDGDPILTWHRCQRMVGPPGWLDPRSNYMYPWVLRTEMFARWKVKYWLNWLWITLQRDYSTHCTVPWPRPWKLLDPLTLNIGQSSQCVCLGTAEGGLILLYWVSIWPLTLQTFPYVSNSKIEWSPHALRLTRWLLWSHILVIL